MSVVDEVDLRREVGLLGVMLGETIVTNKGDDALEIVERLRRAAWDRRVGRPEADDRMREILANLTFDQMRSVARAFTIFLDLFNLVEDRRRIQVLATRARDAYPYPPPESIGAAVRKLKDQGLSAQQVRELLEHLHIELVFTAHPTEAKRRSVRSKLRTIREALRESDASPLPSRSDELSRQMKSNILKLWQTNFIRPHRPTVMQEVARGLSMKPVLWDVVPQINRELDGAIEEAYGEQARRIASPVTFGSWIGGDRDGHPGVTTDVTSSTLQWLRREAISLHLSSCDALFESWTMSTTQSEGGCGLEGEVKKCVERYSSLGPRLEGLPPGEVWRQFLSIIRWRLEQTAVQSAPVPTAYIDPDLASSHVTFADGTVAEPDAVYRDGDDLIEDLGKLRDAVTKIPGGEMLVEEIRRWMYQAETFGLHLACLDIRQNAKVFAEVMTALAAQCDPALDFESASEEAKCQWLSQTLDQSIAIDDELVSSDTIVGETLRLFRLLHNVVQRESSKALGSLIISMTAATSDVLSVLWLWKHSGDGSVPPPPIVPLLETIEDLQNGPAILRAMLNHPAYRQCVRHQGDHQLIMLGYSDSTKDGGYLSACWSLHRAQRELVDIGNEFETAISFFHGRGGSLGRGGGPAARSIQSLPEGTFFGRLRLTEQGEVLAQRYDDPAIAHRHLEQMVGSTLLSAADNLSDFEVSGGGRHEDRLHDYEVMSAAAEESFRTYRQLLEHPGFIHYFRHATPISEIEQLPIGSRPSRRKPDGGLADLRAIPWVFSWTQSRCLIPAWYGIGTALSSRVADADGLAHLQLMYRRWPFFKAVIENAELALAKADMKIARQYAELAEEDENAVAIGQRIVQEYRSSVSAVLAINGQDELLERTAWLKESIRVRNRFIDPLNFLQIELLRRKFADDSEDGDDEERRHLLRLSINGIASGMRTSG